MISIHNLFVLTTSYIKKLKEMPSESLAAEQKESLLRSLNLISDAAQRTSLPRALVALGILQRDLVRAKVYTSHECSQHVEALMHVGDPPPPAGLSVVSTKLLLPFVCCNCRMPVFMLAKTHWMPVGLSIDALKFPPFDPEGRLTQICGVGMYVDFNIHRSVWDYEDNTVITYLLPVVLHYDISEEAVALAISLLSKAGWAFPDAVADKDWPTRWEAHRNAVKTPHQCSMSSAAEAFTGVLDKIFPDTKKKKKKKKPDHGESTNPEGPTS